MIVLESACSDFLQADSSIYRMGFDREGPASVGSLEVFPSADLVVVKISMDTAAGGRERKRSTVFRFFVMNLNFSVYCFALKRFFCFSVEKQ